MIRKLLALSLTSTLILSGCGQGTLSTPPGNGNANTTPPPTPPTPTTSSAAIKHVVVIFGENVSFDHYFATYPVAANLPGETPFTAAAGTPVPAGLSTALLTNNPNLANSANGAGASNPYRLDPSQAATADQDHDYNDEQKAFDNLKMDLFPLSVGAADSPSFNTGNGANPVNLTKGLVMGYYDGNSVTAIWNYAQHYAINDHSFDTTFGPSTPGAINLASGQTNGVIADDANSAGSIVPDGNGGLTLVSDQDPSGDICSAGTGTVHFSPKNINIGNLLNSANVTWGFFEGGFDLGVTNPDGSTACGRTHTGVAPLPKKADYIPHHEPFQYYASTANLNHLRPTSIAAIGTTDQANHQYDTHDFTDALAAGNMPAVSFLKAPGYQDAHASYSDPLDEQTFLVNTINAIQKSSFWSSTAIILAYDDSDGWYDHLSNVINGSTGPQDFLTSNGVCLSAAAAAAALPDVATGKPALGRCGYGPRLPLIVISSWAKKNAVDSHVTDQTSITRFIEDVFLGSKRIGQGSFDSIAGPLDNMFDFSNGATPPNPNVVILDPATGKVTSGN
jgi:phospholipase C